jgi:hypothetical protein
MVFHRVRGNKNNMAKSRLTHVIVYGPNFPVTYRAATTEVPANVNAPNKNNIPFICCIVYPPKNVIISI